MKSKKEKKMQELLMYIPLAAFIIAFAFNIYQFFQNKALENRYLDQLKPEIADYYKYFAEKHEYRFFIKNVGIIDCKDIWINEKIFLIIDETVYEGRDVPHYNYVIYKGSRDKMFDLQKENEIEVEVPKLQNISFNFIKEKFNAIIISRWQTTFSSVRSLKKFTNESYYIFDFDESNFKNIDDVTGSKYYLNKIKDYLANGTQKNIKIFNVTKNFEIDSPDSYLINADYTITPLELWTKLTINDFNSSKLFSSGNLEIQISDDDEIGDGSVYYCWSYENGEWSKLTKMVDNVRMYSKTLWSPLKYLSNEEVELVNKNPEILKYFNKNREKSKESIKEIEDKARKIYLETKTKD